LKEERYVMVAEDGTVLPAHGCLGKGDAETISKRTGRLHRLATTEEKVNVWREMLPMIEPFEPYQKRTRDRYPTKAEMLEFNLSHPRNKDMPGYNPDWRMPLNAIMGDGLGYRFKDEEKIISYGTSSYGYDIRCAPEFKVFTNVHSAVVDPKNFDDRSFVQMDGMSCLIPPNSFVLARSMEYLRIPRDILVVCLGKSTYARCGIIVNVTPLEPEWEGHITLEFSNTTNLPARIYAEEGCAQLLFLQADKHDVCSTSYADRAGKYQGQTGVTLPKG
jgi:dCTP deaminase